MVTRTRDIPRGTPGNPSAGDGSASPALGGCQLSGATHRPPVSLGAVGKQAGRGIAGALHCLTELSGQQEPGRDVGDTALHATPSDALVNCFAPWD